MSPFDRGITPVSSNKSFFESPQAAAVYKHKLLKTYIPAWAGKVGSTSQGKRVLVYDAYSGPGRYENQEPGSPELLVDTALAMAALRTIKTVFSDREKDYCNQLSSMLTDKGVNPSTYEVRQGPVDEHLDNMLEVAGDVPVFVFLDPFGLTVPMERIVHLLNTRKKQGWSQALQPKTELLMNFSYEAVRRIAGALRSEAEYKAKEGQIASLNAALGGYWWHELARDEPDGWVQQVLVGFASRVAEATGYGFITADVADSLTAKPVYELILFTPHSDGLWEMTEAMSYARRDWRAWLKKKAEEESGGQMELGGLEFADDEAAWVAEIAKNAEALLASGPGFVVGLQIGELLGRTLGLARTTHIRKALRGLYQAQVSATDPKGDLQKLYIARK